MISEHKTRMPEHITHGIVHAGLCVVQRLVARKKKLV